MNVSASVASPLIFWFGIALASGLALYWFLSHYFASHLELEQIEADLAVISARINENCDADFFDINYNPKTENGKISFSPNEVCIETKHIKKCHQLFCGPNANISFDLNSFIFLEFRKKAQQNLAIIPH